jgi:hypothetical protein
MEGTWEERRDAGRALRKTVPRSSHTHWTRPRRQRDPIDVLEEQAQGRIPELVRCPVTTRCPAWAKAEGGRSEAPPGSRPAGPPFVASSAQQS